MGNLKSKIVFGGIDETRAPHRSDRQSDAQPLCFNPEIGWQIRTRTEIDVINNHALYRLSYLPIMKIFTNNPKSKIEEGKRGEKFASTDKRQECSLQTKDRMIYAFFCPRKYFARVCFGRIVLKKLEAKARVELASFCLQDRRFLLTLSSIARKKLWLRRQDLNL